MTNTFPGVKSYSELLRLTKNDNPRMHQIIEDYYATRFEVEYRRFMENRRRNDERG